MSLHFDYEWARVAASPDEAAHRTMANLRVRVNGRLVTAVTDHQHKRDRDHVLVPLQHVAEWLVSNWYPLLYEPENSGDPQRPGFASRHSLAFAGDGFILPSLTIAPTDGATTMRWAPSKPAFSEIEFTGHGEERVPTDEVEHVCSSLIEDVLGKMRQENVPSETLEEAWQDVRGLDEEERDFARAAALLGADPFDLDDALADGIVAFWEGIAPSLRRDSLAAATGAESLPAVKRWVERSLRVLDEQASDAATSGWTDIRNSVPRSDSPIPWKRGYDLAESLRREVLGHSSHDPNALGDELDTPYRRMHSVSSRVQGLVAAGSPACVGTVSSDATRRFLQARSIGAFLSPSEPGPSLLSTMTTDFQAFTRAFAAELLAPAEQLRARLKGGRTSVAALARELRVSPFVISHQIRNHRSGFATEG